MAFLAPIIAGAVGALGVGAAAAGVIGTIGATVIGLGASIAASLIFNRKSSTSSTSVSGMEGDVSIGGEVARQVVFGTAALSGHLIYVNSWGTSNAHEEEVYALADWRCDALVGLIVDGEEKTLIAQPALYGETARFSVDGYGDKLDLRFYAGLPSQTSDAGLIAHSNPLGRWTAAHRGDGLCYVVVDKTYDADLFSGFPTFKFILRGAHLYDWRRDTTAGGSGPQRFDDPTTWDFSANPACALYTYQRGFFAGGAILMGQGVPAIDLVQDLYTAAANVADEDVALAAGGSEKRYEISAIATDDAEHRDVIDACVAALGGWLYERAGAFAPIAGAAQSTVATITDGDLVLGGSVKVTRKRSRADLVNYISGSFVSPADLWESKGYTAISSSTNEAADGERLGKSLDLKQIASQTRAERIALLRYNENRCQTTATIPLSLRAIALEVGDWIRWNSGRYGDRVYRITDWRLTPTGDQIGLSLGLSEISASVYGWSALVDENPPLSTGSGRSDGPMTRSLAGLVVQASSATSALGETIPALIVTWTPPADSTVTAVTIEYRRVGETAASVARSDTPEAGRIEITGLLGGASYEVRATIVTDPPRAVTWTVWTPIETTATSYPVTIDTTDLVPSLAAMVAGIGASVADLKATALRELLARTADRARATSIGASVRTEITEKYDAVTGALASRVDTVEAGVATAAASVVSEATARADADGALGSRIDTVTAATESTAAAISSESTARTDADSALSGRIDTVVAAVGDVEASGSAKLVAAADQSGALARYELWVKTALNGGGAFASAAMTIEAVSVGGVNVSQIKFRADRFYVMNASGDTVAPLAVVGSTVFMDQLQVRHQIILGSGGSGGSILIRD